MSFKKLSTSQRHRGAVLIISMIFVVVFSALAVSMATLSGANTQIASNQHKVNSALLAAQSGLECARYIVSTVTLEETSYNIVTDDEADQVWSDLCQHLQTNPLGGQSVSESTRFTDSVGSGDQVVTSATSFGAANVDFAVRFYRYDSHPRTIKMESIGSEGEVVRKIRMDMEVTKDSEVLTYAIASRGRMWLTGDTTIYGDIFSSWDRPEISPYNMTSDSAVLGTINTVLTLDDIQDHGYQLETLDENGNPIDINGDPLGSNYEDRYYGPDDEVQAYHEGINYEQPYEDIPGMDISDYDTDLYNDGLTDIPSCPSELRETEYFPHAAGDYSQPKSGSSRKLVRHVYENQTLTDAHLAYNRNALFRNCTFEGILYIDCNKSGSSYYNNVRFENCTFNGVIVTNVPQVFKWQHNCLYFTGEATFDNTSDVQEATILAPHFNVNLGNTNPEQSDNNVLTGAIVGGIVDVRGNAQIYGTIISMCDTTQWSSGYVTNIGATLDDGGSETTELGDIGVIGITPEEDKMLPSGITSPIVIKPKQDTYAEGV
jgi:hypothetical protein